MTTSRRLSMTRNRLAYLALGALYLAIGSVGSAQETSYPATGSPPSATSSQGQDESEVRKAGDLLRQNRLDAAISLLKPLQAASPRVPRAAHELGLAYYRKAEYLLALAPLKAALEENADDKEAIQLLGLTYFHIGQ